MSSNTTFSRGTLWLLTVATGLCVGNLYYCQPLLTQIRDSLHATDAAIGWIPTLTQLGYAVGMLLLIPLGDRFERRALIAGATFISAVALVLMAIAPNLPFAILASFLIGLTTMTPQLIMPFVAHVAEPSRRTQMVATVVSGLLIGILLARTVAGFLGSALGWRAMFAVAAVVLIALSAALRFALPLSPASFAGSYAELLRSVFVLVREQPVLRESMVYGGALFAAFSAFWATLIHHVESPVFGLGARTVGLFGLVGAAGALAAPVFGRLADRRDPRFSIGLGIAVTASAFVVYFLGAASLAGLAIGVLLMDVGAQATHVSNQGRYFALVPEARSRLNTAYMFAYFTGGAAGSALGSFAWDRFQWPGVCVVGLGFCALAGAVFLKTAKKR